MLVSLFPHENTARFVARDLAWGDFAAGFSRHDHTRLTKQGLPCFSPAEFLPGATHKNRSAVSKVHFGVLDLDKVSTQQVQQVMASLQGLSAVVYTTWSHPEEWQRS